MPKVAPHSNFSFLRRLVAPSFPKAIAIAAFLCGSILFKYRTPIQITAHASKVRPAVTKPVAKKITAIKKVEAEPKVQMSPAPAMGNRAVVAPKLAQKAPAKKSRKKVVATTTAMKRFFLAAAKLEPDFDWPEVDESLLAVNVSNPLDSVADEALSQEFAKESDDAGLSINLVNLKPAAPEVRVADDRLQVIIGEVVQNDFKEINDKITAQKAAFQAIVPPEPELVRPEPKLVKVAAVEKVQKKKAPRVKKAVAVVKAEPTLVLPKTQKVATAKAVTLPVEAKSAPKTPADLNAYFAKMGSLGGIIDEVSTPATKSAPLTTQPSVTTGAPATIQAVPEQRVAKDEKNVLVIPAAGQKNEMTTASQGQVQVVPPKEDRKAIDPRRTGMEELIQGKLELTNKVIDWVEMKDAHIELSLMAVGNLSSQGVLPVDYSFPNEDFYGDLRGRKGEYWLQATFYPNKGAEALTLPIRYKGKISAASQNQFIHFEINEQMLETAIQGMHSAPSNGIWFTSIFYKVDPAKHKPDEDPKKQRENRVTNGEISFVGFPKWGPYSISTDGIAQAALPARSELLAKVTAPGYYPTYQIIPTFSSGINSYIYLANEKELDPIIRYFTGSPQAKLDVLSPGMIFLRNFEPTTFEPLPQVPIEISHPNSAKLLLPASTETGFGGAAHVSPSMRMIGRGKDHPRWLVNVPEGSSQYVEFGRGGKRALVGKLVSLQGEPVGPARVRLAGDKSSETWSDDVGNFRFEALDFPPGIVTLEIEAPQFGLTWYNVAFDPSQPERTQKVYLRSLEEEAQDRGHSEIPSVDENFGVVNGALSASFFHEDCVFLRLTDTSGKEVPLDKGPFPLGPARRNDQNPYCLPRTEKEKSLFKYINLRDGEYIFKAESASGKLLRAHVLRVGARKRRTVTVD